MISDSKILSEQCWKKGYSWLAYENVPNQVLTYTLTPIAVDAQVGNLPRQQSSSTFLGLPLILPLGWCLPLYCPNIFSLAFLVVSSHQDLPLRFPSEASLVLFLTRDLPTCTSTF